MSDETLETATAAGREDFESRAARLRVEQAALLSEHPDALGERLLKMLALGNYTAPSEGQALTFDRVMTQVAAAQLKAVSIALMRGGEGCEDNFEIDFTFDDAAKAIAGVATVLEFGPELASGVLDAREQAERQAQRRRPKDDESEERAQ